MTSVQHQTSTTTIPLILTSTTLLALIILACLQYREENSFVAANENEMLLRAMKRSGKSKKRSD